MDALRKSIGGGGGAAPPEPSKKPAKKAKKATPGQKNTKNYYKFIGWLYPIGRALYPAGFCTLREVGLAMIKAANQGSPKQILEVGDIVKLAKGSMS